jgi:hypothetical protein
MNFFDCQQQTHRETNANDEFLFSGELETEIAKSEAARREHTLILPVAGQSDYSSCSEFAAVSGRGCGKHLLSMKISALGSGSACSLVMSKWRRLSPSIKSKLFWLAWIIIAATNFK